MKHASVFTCDGRYRPTRIIVDNAARIIAVALVDLRRQLLPSRLRKNTSWPLMVSSFSRWPLPL